MEAIADYTVVYLLPSAEGSTASPEPASPGMYRHESKFRARGEGEIVRQVVLKGGTVISITRDRPVNNWMNPVPKEYKRQLLQATTFSCRGGMSPGRALQSVIENETGPLRARLEPALSTLTSGGSCYEAIKAIELYDETTLAIIEAGELTGAIADALETAAKHQDGRAAEQRIMFGAVTWTLMDILFSISGIAGNIWGLLPQAESSMQNVAAEAAERVERAIHIAYIINWALLFGTFLMLGLFAYCALGAMSKNAKWRAGADKALQEIPFFSIAVLESAIASSCTVANSLVKGGVSLITVSDIASRSTRNWQVRLFWDGVVRKLNHGETIARCFASTTLFTNAERLLLVSHSSREQLADTFGQIAAQRRLRAETAAKKFSAFAFFGSLIYSSLAVCVSLWVSYLQYSAMMASNNSLG